MIANLDSRLGRYLRRLRPTDFLVMLGTAILVGISTGLLAVNDEVLEVNGIEVASPSHSCPGNICR